jgi:hypothetical protein
MLSSWARAASTRCAISSVLDGVPSASRCSPISRFIDSELPVLLPRLGIGEEVFSEVAAASHDGGEHLPAGSEQHIDRVGGRAAEVDVGEDLGGPQFCERSGDAVRSRD